MGKQARNQSRERRQARLAAERRARNRNRVLAAGGGLVIVVLLVAIGVTFVKAATGSDAPSAANRELVVPATAEQGALMIGQSDAPVRLDVYLDYMCPYCGLFERANADELDRLVGDGTVRMALYPLSFLDRMSQGSRYSSRTANAIATVADRAPEKVLAFNRELFAKQPEENTKGLSDDEIAALATRAGVPEDVIGSFGDGIFEPWVASATQAAFDSGITGTPTVKINGQVFQGELYHAGPLTQAITAAKGR